MRRIILSVATLVIFSLTCFAQTGTSDSQTLQALLKEVQQIHEDLRMTNAVTQRAQILVYRLQDEEAAVARAAQRFDNTQASLNRVQIDRKMVEQNIKQDEDFQTSEDAPPAQKKAVETTLAEFRSRLEALQIEEQSARAQHADAEQRLRSEEMTLGELRGELEGIDRSLANVAHRPVIAPQ